LAVDWRSLVATVIFGVDFHDATMDIEHIPEILGRLVAVENTAECAALRTDLGLVSQRRQILQRQLCENTKQNYAKRYSVTSITFR